MTSKPGRINKMQADASRNRRHFGSDAVYENLKRDWIARYPNASSADYQAAMIRIARKAAI